MAAANSNVKLAGLDFDAIKNNLKTFLQSQDTFKDYNFEGAGLSVLLDILAYNTQYNAFYLNMVANEMFMDTALQRSSVVSQAKLLDYVPKSAIAPTAFVDVIVSGLSSTTSSLTLPSYTNFLSESINGINYNFVTTKSTTINTDSNTNTVTFSNIELKQGIPVSYTFTVDSTSNSTYTFELPDSNIDTSTIMVTVQQSLSDTSYEIYTKADAYSVITSTNIVNSSSISTSPIFFLQEGLNGNYQIYFGDGIIGNKLSDGNIVIVSYITTQGTSSSGANNFVLMDSLTGFVNTTVYGKYPTSSGSDKESINSIKFQAPKSYAAQNRAVTKDDYITMIQQNNLGISFDAVNVWGGQENNPPVYGNVFVCMKPQGSYSMTSVQKDIIKKQILAPISMMTVTPIIIDPDYTYIKVTASVTYNPQKTNLGSTDIQNLITSVISNFGITTLNTFNSTFSSSELLIQIQNSNPSIIACELKVQLQKKILPNLTSPTTYNMYFNVPIQKGMFESGISSSPAVQYIDQTNSANIIDGIYVEEVPSSTGGVAYISVINSGYAYQYPPTVTILGDGTGATAEALLNTNGTIRSINVLTSGNNYTSAIVNITPLFEDKTGTNGGAVVILEGQYGILRTFYYNNNQTKVILNPNAGTVDYVNGVVTLTNFNPIEVNNPLGQLSITINPTTTIVSSSQNRIITIDPYDPNAITVNVTAKV